MRTNWFTIVAQALIVTLSVYAASVGSVLYIPLIIALMVVSTIRGFQIGRQCSKE